MFSFQKPPATHIGQPGIDSFREGLVALFLHLLIDLLTGIVEYPELDHLQGSDQQAGSDFGAVLVDQIGYPVDELLCQLPLAFDVLVDFHGAHSFSSGWALANQSLNASSMARNSMSVLLGGRSLPSRPVQPFGS